MSSRKADRAKVLTAMVLDATTYLAQRRSPAPGAGASPLVGSGSGTYSIDSRARLRDGREAMLRAVVRAGGNGLPGSAYTPLRWEELDDEGLDPQGWTIRTIGARLAEVGDPWAGIGRHARDVGPARRKLGRR